MRITAVGGCLVMSSSIPWLNPGATRLGSCAHLDARLLVDEVDELGEDERVRVREHAVSEVEDVPAPAGDAIDDQLGRLLHPLPGAEQHGGVEVALHAAPVAED